MNRLLNWVDAEQKKKEKQMTEFLETPRGKKVKDSPQMKRYQEKRLKKMQPEVERRLNEEADDTKGQQVWFSRYISNGRLRHWVLMTHGYKYELRRSANAGEESGDEDPATTKFTPNVMPFTIDQEKRNAALAESSLPDVDGFYVCLIGWTTKTKDEVDRACRSVGKDFGKYDLLWNNCQDFLRNFAERIIVTKALDYPWFLTNTKARYQKTQSLQPPPLQYLLKLQLQSRAQIQLQTQLQTQLQIQMQIQIQNQIQLQIQNQMQLQMQLQNQ
ncbi:MAG: hypothetical protein Q9195_004959 [Heterodermia aff. obscurata]